MVHLVLNLVLWKENSSAAAPGGTLMLLLALWFGVSFPLTFLGSYIGFKRTMAESPMKTNEIPRIIPRQRFCNRHFMSAILGGVLPFCCSFMQVFFILNSLWSDQIYYMFGFLLLTFILLIATCSACTMLLCYFHLRAEDYRWWWRSFFISGSIGVYFFIYSIHYFRTKLTISDSISTFIYFGYAFTLCITSTLMTGAIGFLACYLFVHKIYGAIKPVKPAIINLENMEDPFKSSDV